MIRLSRPCYDKPHRCPGWAGGGWKYGKVDRCDNGSIRTRGSTAMFWFEDLEEGYPGVNVWHFGRCAKCDTTTWPFALRRLDPTYWLVLFECWIQNLKWKRENR